MRIHDIKESASGGSTGAGSIASVNSPVGNMVRRRAYNEDEVDDISDLPDSQTQNSYSFISNFRKNPHFVKFHALNATSNGYVAEVELDDGHTYEIVLSTIR